MRVLLFGLRCSGILLPEGALRDCCGALHCVTCSRAVLGRQVPSPVPSPDAPHATHFQAVPLSDDHKPDIPSEMARILKSGGRVTLQEYGVPRVWLADMSAPGLAMSRSIGDSIAHRVGVIPLPDIRTAEITDADRLMILASDGVWEFISNDEAVKLCSHYLNLSPQLVRECVLRMAFACSVPVSFLEAPSRVTFTAALCRLRRR